MLKTYHHLTKRRINQLILSHISQLNKITTRSNVPKKQFKTISNVEMIYNYSNSESTSNETNSLLSDSIFDSSNNILNLSMHNYSSSISNSFNISIASNHDNSSLFNFSTKSINFNNEISIQNEQSMSLQEDLKILISECCIPQSTVDKLLLIL